MDDYISRADAMGAVQDHFNADGFKGYDDGQKMMNRITALPSAEAVTIHEDGTLEVKVSNAHKVGRVLVMDTDSHIGGGLFYPDDSDAEWIPCSERLPSEYEVVLASWSCLWKDAIVLARRYEGKWEWAYEHGADYWQPTELEEYWPEAWQPLPTPYKGGDDK